MAKTKPPAARKIPIGSLPKSTQRRARRTDSRTSSAETTRHLNHAISCSHGHVTEQHSDLEIETWLRDKGLKVTSPRKSVLALSVQLARPFSTDEIFLALKQNYADEKWDLVTVYRTLARFEELQLLSRCDFGDGIARFEFQGIGAKHHHHHIICTSCQTVEPVEFCLVADQENSIRSLGYKHVTHRLEFFGICKSCQAKN